MARAHNGPVEIEYEVHGDLANPTILFIMGLGGQMIAWDPAFIDLFTAQGFSAITFDNRDVGKSTWFDEHGEVDVLPFQLGEPIDAPYLLSDMAADAASVLDAAGVASAHILGISMGGMIAQQFVIDFPARTLTLTSIMSTTGSPMVGQPTEAALGALLRAPATSRDAAIESDVETWRIISSPDFPFREDEIRSRAGVAHDRGYHPVGTNRQLAAILASGDRTEHLGALDIPTLVIHGTKDPLVQPSGGEATAAAIPGARHVTFEGMGHDLPLELVPAIVEEILAHIN